LLKDCSCSRKSQVIYRFGLSSITTRGLHSSVHIRRTEKSKPLRKQEVCNLNIVDVNFDTTFIKVHGKGNKERLVPMGFGIVKIIRDYMKWRKYIETDENALFTTVEGKRIGLWTMQSIFRRIKKKSGLTGERISCATSRHTFAKDYLLNGGDIFSLQKILGHSNIATTKKYLNLNENEVREQYQKFNPLDNRDWML